MRDDESQSRWRQGTNYLLVVRMMNPSISASRQRLPGFTLIEMMVTVAVLAVVMAVVSPNLAPMLASLQLRTASYDLLGDMVLARSEALKRGATVQILPSATGWTGGWTVTTSAVTDALSQRNRMGNSISVTPAPSSISFDLNGRVLNATTTVRIGLNDGHAHYRCISLDPAGRPKSANTGCPT